MFVYSEEKLNKIVEYCYLLIAYHGISDNTETKYEWYQNATPDEASGLSFSLVQKDNGLYLYVDECSEMDSINWILGMEIHNEGNKKFNINIPDSNPKNLNKEFEKIEELGEKLAFKEKLHSNLDNKSLIKKKHKV
jgi:hypothetical protein